MAGQIEGKVAVITGAASGIGAATARLFVAEGAKVVLADIQDERGARMVEELGPSASYRHTDVTNEDDIEGAVGHAVEKFGRLDVMFNNAGRGHAEGLIEDLTPQMFREVTDILLGSVVFGMKHAVPVMKRQGSGVIINTASIAGLGVGYGGSMYSASKAAVIHLTRVIANEVGESNIRVNAIAPGAIPTAIFGRAGGMTQEAAEALIPMLRAGFATAQPIPRSGDANDVANAALWLASEASSFVTGICIPVEGGLTTGKLFSQRVAEMQGAGGT
ncbi:MAG: SDR family oxidoreductase [Dehalococcoidia bacterium]|uniref:SDR family oxidoreductase n=1 Tax=Candidatus Amarobacter glycogenicus TaxID=3140699 RepID=UPI002A0E89BF|nr:SDR family oxidoreductase [Dehalococcoidia bacterium]MBK8560073.1 SDR family oxidoreductase [Dehalococcoidia bacterium]MBK9544829.1 SDR family oxidoreductase [Dehalococcoidia bacterium]MBK9611397.1 SDR family oxidoreductase [Dehalococcoidia bacterium]